MDRFLDCSDDGTLAALGEDHDPHLLQFGVCRGGQGERYRLGTKVFQASNPLQAADHTRMLQTMATVFTAADLGRIGWIDQSGVEVAF